MPRPHAFGLSGEREFKAQTEVLSGRRIAAAGEQGLVCLAVIVETH